VVTSDKEEFADTGSDEESRKPMKESLATAIPADSIARAILPSLCLCLSSLTSCTTDKPVPPPLSPEFQIIFVVSYSVAVSWANSDSEM
jgi:hypothetical protein